MVRRRSVLVAFVAVLCAGGLGAPAGAAIRRIGARLQPIVTPATGLRAGVMPTRRQARRAARQAGISASSVAALTYRGGPVVTNAKVQSVLWGTGTYLPEEDGTATPNMDTFFGHVGNSAYVSWLDGEYATPAAGGTNQSIGYGSFLGRTTITPSGSATTVLDSTIQNELVAQIGAGHLPAPVGDGAGHTNTVYAVFFPSGTTICMSAGVCSGSQFCAYHGATTVTVSGLHLLYLALPYPDSNEIVGCGNSGVAYPTLLNYASHELIETITDPEVGISQLAWYDDTNGEIGDICNGQSSTVTGTDTVAYTVQKEWSNALNTCIAQKAPAVPDAPTSPSATAVSAGRITVSWSPPGTDGGTAITGYLVYRSTSPGVLGTPVATVSPPALTWTSGALTDATPYYFQVVAHNVVGDGPPSSQVAATADSTAPTVTITAPTQPFQLPATVTVRYSASGAASYDVQYRRAAWNGGFGAYANLASATTAISRSITGAPGHEYCFRVRARDAAGNPSAWTHDRCTAVPLDDRALTATTSGWSRITSSAAYLGTLTRSTTSGSALKLTGAQTDRLGLVVSTCSTCGTVAIYLGSALWHTVSTASATTHAKVVELPGTFSLRTTTVVLKNASSGKPVLIDGLGIART